MLTQKEEKVLQCITRYIAIEGHGPTLEEIGSDVGINSRGTVHRYVKALEDKGHLQRNPHYSGMRLTGEAERHSNILPFVGRISAGKPIEAITDQEEINFSELLLGADRYVLKIDGDSMIDAGIHDGDYVVIKHADTAKTGDIVVALIDQSEATLKRLKRRRGGIELIPENASMEPMFYDAERVQIQGVLVGQVRLY
ncbi:MAG: repressor LexA [Gammaproteobacteria bacterium]|jgi:repressor LexA